MRFFLICAALLVASPAAHARMWVDAECMNILVRYETAFLFVNKNTITTCHLDSWPIDNPVAQIACDRENTTTTLEILDPRTILFNGLEMNRYEGPIPCGAGDAEWPD